MTRRWTATLAIAAALALGAAATGCSSSDGSAAGGGSAGSTAPGTEAPATSATSAPTTAAGPTGAGVGRTCTPTTAQASVPATTPVDADGNATLTSFDGTKLQIHWFPQPGLAPGAQAPTVLMGPGWGMGGDTDAERTVANGALLSVFGVNIPTLHEQGYNVLTWDPRGFGRSGGTVEVDSKDFEGRDVQRILSWVAAQPQAQVDGKGDPHVGMVGGSYGGGIQIVSAAIDCRVDVIVPEIAWNSLETSLYKADTVKSGWAGLLYAAAGGRNLDPHLKSSYDAGFSTGVLSDEDRTWFVDRGPADLLSKVRIPTLFVQGTVDTLFTLDEAITNFQAVRKNGVPTAMVWFCGGHGFCLTDPGNKGRVTDATFAWLQRYLKGDATAPAQPTFETVDQDGNRFTGNAYPLPVRDPIAADGAGTLALMDMGGAGPATVPEGDTDLLATFAKNITPAKADNAVNVPITWGDRGALVVGAPTIRLTYHGSAGPEQRPERVFAQLVDDQTGLVLGNQITPVPVVLDSRTHTVEVPLEVVAFSAKPGGSATLQIVANTVAYARGRLGGSITFDQVHVELPVVNADPG